MPEPHSSPHSPPILLTRSHERALQDCHRSRDSPTSPRQTESSRSSLLPSVSSSFSPLSPTPFHARFGALQGLSHELRWAVHGAATNHRGNCFLWPRKDRGRACLDLLSLPVFSVRKTVPRSLLSSNAGELQGRRPWHAPHRLTPGHAEGMDGLAKVTSFSRFEHAP